MRGTPCAIQLRRTEGILVASRHLLSTRKVARITGIPESTVRWYQRQFAGFLPVTRDARGVWWEPEALALIRTIRENFAAGLAREDVAHVLASSAVHEDRQDARARRTVVQAVVDRAQAMEALQADVAQIRREMQMFQSSRKALTLIDERVARIENALTQLNGQVSSLTQQVGRLVEAAATSPKEKRFWRRD